ncbi:DUF4259 domain-containing protein [Leptospira alexanderi]|uniref:DUF4259 domain-containing protein n=1 Tax=Leptospira alexanderi TaxID=100053 RepID=UPI0009910F5F|nr:DUF4259 domain-containing protein [Leptospira alexanderi]
MGSWGIKALESDEGLDVVGFLKENISDDFEFKLSEIIQLMKGGLLGNHFEKIDLLYDNSAMALAELYFMFKDKGKLDFGNDDDNDEKSLCDIRSFAADKNSLQYILKYLMDIKNEISDKDGIREIIELWQDSDSWEDWKNHLKDLFKESMMK